MGMVQARHLTQEVHVTRKQLHVRCELCPSGSFRVVAGRQLELAHYISRLVVKVASDRLHPCVISVSVFHKKTFSKSKKLVVLRLVVLVPVSEYVL